MTTDAPQRSPAAGWYHDPQVPTQLRWWDGATWTAHTRPVEDAPIVPPAAPVFTQSTLSTTYVPFATMSPAASVDHRPFVPDVTYTKPSWAIALSPLWLLGVGVIAAFLLPAIDPALLSFVYAGISLVTLIALIILAVADRGQLRGEGHLAPASALWVILSPLVYLIVRGINTRAVTGQGFKLLVAYLIVSVLSPIAFALAVFAIVGLGLMPVPPFVPTP